MKQIKGFLDKALSDEIQILQKDLENVRAIENAKYNWQINLDDYHLCSWSTEDIAVQEQGTLIEAFRKALAAFKEANGTDYVDLREGGICIAAICPSGHKISLPLKLWERPIHRLLHNLGVKHDYENKPCQGIAGK